MFSLGTNATACIFDELRAADDFLKQSEQTIILWSTQRGAEQNEHNRAVFLEHLILPSPC